MGQRQQIDIVWAIRRDHFGLMSCVSRQYSRRKEQTKDIMEYITIPRSRPVLRCE
ncbi:hypothetical protein ccbrp13_20780 [Ktedonobacteria bacterium brp13]|nr:hypothetical protein ccbrp13_20780 [Ktedonobacteria bacterium brp13]